MDKDFDSTTDIQTELDNYFCEDPTASDPEEDDVDEDFDSDDNLSNVDLTESGDEEDVNSPEAVTNDLETLRQFTLQLQDDLSNSILNDLSAAHLNLNAEQRQVLERCHNPALKRLLLLNRLKSAHCLEFIKKIDKSNTVCNGIINNLMRKQAMTRECILERKVSEMHALNAWRLGFPYFKTQKYVSPHYNADYHRKIANHELVFTSFTEGRRWIYDDQVALYNAICDGYLSYRKRMVEQQLRYVNSTYKVFPNDVIQTQIDNLKNQLQSIEDEKEYKAPPRDDESGMDWLKTISDLHNIHSAIECKAFWRIYLHPDINKSDWTKHENLQILLLVQKYKSQDWEAIAKELNTNRTGFLVIVHYFSNLCDKFKRDRFSAAEDEKLLNAVEEHRLGHMIPWTAVAGSFGSVRSKHQLYHRYTYYLEPGKVKKGAFTEAEDILLSYLVDQFGKNYSTIRNYMDHRTGVQLRNRYSNYLEKLTCNLGIFTAEDDEQILNYVKENGESHWSELSNQLQRGRAHVRQRYSTIKKHIEKNPEMSVKSLPRKQKAHFLRNYNERVVSLEIVLDILKRNIKGIPTITTVERYLKKYRIEKQEKCLRVCRTYKRREASSIDQELIQFFKTVCRVQRRVTKKQQEDVKDSANRVIKLLYLLGSNRNLFDRIDLMSDLPIPCDFDLLVEIKNLYHQDYLSKLSTAAGSSSLASVSFNSSVIKEILPPTICTLVGIRGLVIKLGELMESPERIVPDIRSNSLETFTLQSLPAEMDEFTKSVIVKERNLFLERLVTLFKWPTILSQSYPSEQVANCKEVEEPVVEVPQMDEVVQAPKRKGRPKKPSTYDKINRMVQAKRKNRVVEIIDSGDEEQGPSKRPKKEPLVKYYPSRAKIAKVFKRKNNHNAGVPEEQPPSKEL